MEGGWGRGTTADKSAKGRAYIILKEGLIKSTYEGNRGTGDMVNERADKRVT